ncbi:hypothetical protein L6164_037360 [Bauhinia variegata]|uniref:Uncharacterized protein n=1 Tax=Bauhinia variegata TaxID=167791 RepID=A0ACB9KJT6_BAUVA|nr:hypothetical protein L6164_037360 [Bauhinia variegata]
MVEPEEILKQRTITQNNIQVPQVLVKWKKFPVSKVTWEDEDIIRGQFPEVNLEDKAVFPRVKTREHISTVITTVLNGGQNRRRNREDQKQEAYSIYTQFRGSRKIATSTVPELRMEFLPSIVGTVFGKLWDYTAAPIGRQFGYLIFYRSNVNELKELLNKLDAQKEPLQHRVEDAQRNGQEIEGSVQKWLDSVDGIKQKADKFYDEGSQANTGSSYRSCVNLCSRHQQSRKAKKMAEEVVELMKGNNFNSVSYIKRVQWAVTSSTSSSRGNEAFESRVRTLDRVMEALADPTINMVGVHGLPGVGKTTLAKEVAKKAQGENLYDMVVMVEVKQNPDNKTIQREIADMVGLKFDEESEVMRASRLCDRLKREKKLLVILDDLWERLDLCRIGIPFPDEQKGGKIPYADGYKGCKILLTSRSEEVLSSQMNCKRNIMVEVLTEKEALKLFKEMAELHTVNDKDLLTVADQVAETCAGLPIAIVTVARALRNKGLYAWRDALQQLRQPELRNVQELKVVDSSIKLSYDHLESKELKLILLLSAMQAVYALAPDLLKYCLGIGVFQGIRTLEGAQYRLQTLIQKLKASCLLLDTTVVDGFQMHDVVRAVALSIAINEHHAFVDSYNKIHQWPDLQNCKFMSLQYCDITVLPQKLSCPRLETLLLGYRSTTLIIPENFFQEMPSLKVVDLTGFHLSSLPSSIILLTNLATLCLDQCVLGDIAMIGELKNLKVLSLFHSIINRLPQQLGKLTQLQLLDLRDCTNLEVIPENVLLSLKKLEVLYLENSFNRWQNEGSNDNPGNARVAELKELADLSSLYMHVPDASILPMDLPLENLKRYKLLIGDVWEWSCKYETSRTLKLKLKISIHSKYGLKSLLGKVESLYLDELIGIKDVVYELNREGFPYLQHLWIHNNPQIEFLVNSTYGGHGQDAFPELETLVLANMIHLEKFCQGHLTEKSLRKLRVIEIESCHQMKILFSISLVRCFSQLEEIIISTCKRMNHIVETIDKTQFLKLHSLTLNNLPAFVSFYCDNGSSDSTMSNKELDTLEPIFNDKIEFPKMESLRLSSINFPKIWQDFPSAYSWIKSLKNLIIEGCGSLQKIVSTVQAMSLQNLNYLEIRGCEKVEEIFSSNANADAPSSEEVIFPSLETVIFSHMDNLQKIWPNHAAPNSFKKLKNVEIDNCEKLVTVFPSYMQRSLCHVEKVTVTGCGSVKTIYDLEGHRIGEGQGQLKANLRDLKLLSLGNLELIWNNGPSPYVNFSNVQTVEVIACDRLKKIFPTYVAMNLDLLEKLRIENCDHLEEVVAKGENANGSTIFNLPHLKSLVLMELCQFKRFYPGMHILECPKLKNLYVLNCPKLELFGQKTNNLPEIEDQLGQLDVAIGQPLFSVEKVVPHLEVLSLSGKEARKIWKGQFREDLFHEIVQLYLQEFANKVADFPYWFLHKMPKLNTMFVKSSLFREMFPVRSLVAEEKQTADIVRLKKLILWNLPRLECICIEGLQLDPVLEKLEELHVWGCSGLANLVPSSASFNCLTFLEVYQCDGLKNLFVPSSAKRLVHLTYMTIKECKMLQEIVAKVEDDIEDEVSFRQLESLKLMSLSNLSSFCSGNINFDFPYLQEVIVTQCPKMNIFSQGEIKSTRLRNVRHGKEDQSSWVGDLNSSIKKLYEEKVGYFGIEELKFHEHPEFIEIWNGKYTNWSFSNLKSLIIDKCDSLSCVIPSHLQSSLTNLEELQVSNCNSVQVVFDVNQTHALVLLGLKIMTLKHLPKLMYVWNKDPQQIDMCQHLQNLHAENCQSLRKIFPASIAKHLKQLRNLRLVDCGVEEIVSMEVTEADTTFVFPQLSTLSLLKLPYLKIFYPMRHTLECPKLRKLGIFQCQNLQVFGTVEAHGLETQHPLFLFEKVNFNLDELYLNQKAFISIRNGQLQADQFHEVKHLVLESFHEEPLTFPYSFLEKFPNLNLLHVSHSTFGEIFPCQELLLDHMGNFPPIKELNLSHLGQLTNLMSRDSQFAPVLQYLEVLDVYCCPRLMNLAPSSALFDNLESLNVSNCRGLIYLVISSTARSFVQLKRLKITDCELMEEIVKCKAEDVQIKIAIQKLEYLELNGLSNLKSFCSLNCAFEFLSLYEIIVKGCSKMKMFCPGILRTPLLEGVISEDDHVYWEDNLNKTIQYLHMVGYFGIEKMKFDEYPELIEIWNGKLPNWSFSNLKSLIIDECDLLSCAIPSHLLLPLSNLEELRVSKCNSIQVIFDLQQVNQTNALVPLRLKRMSLSHLPKLMYVWNKDPQLIELCQYLQELYAVECRSLRSIFPASIAKNLKQLQELEIISCGVEEIVSKVEVSEADANFVFPQLCWLRLYWLPNLKSFYPKRHKLECPKLRTLYVGQCENLDVFGTVEVEENSGLESQYPMFLLEEVNFNLEVLALNQKAVIRIRNSQHQADLFHKVNILSLECFHDEPLTFPYSFLERFPSLNELNMVHCSFEEIFPCQEPFSDHLGNFPSIKELGLCLLDQLKNINENYQLGPILQYLASLRVGSCPMLKNLASSSTLFDNLEFLDVSYCHGLIYLLASSTARSFAQLKRLKVTHCEMIEEIVTGESEDLQNKIAFQKLEYLELIGLSNLKSFCSQNFTFEFPSLVAIIVRGCFHMEMFCPGILSTPLLKGVNVEDNQLCWADNLNKTIQLLWMARNNQQNEAIIQSNS